MHEFKYYHYSPLKNSSICQNDPVNYDSYGLERKKSFKVRVRKRLIYTFELFYFSEFIFVKFHPKILEEHPDKYKVVGIGLSIEEKRGLLNTCCRIVYNEISREGQNTFAFIGEHYDRDNKLNRVSTVRYSWYKKQIALFFSGEKFNHIDLPLINFYCLSNLPKEKLVIKMEKLKTVLFNNQSLLLGFMTDETKRKIMEDSMPA